jgi:hypothetical protein
MVSIVAHDRLRRHLRSPGGYSGRRLQGVPVHTSVLLRARSARSARALPFRRWRRSGRGLAAGLAVPLLAGLTPPRAPHSDAPASAGVYVLARATGSRPPIPFAIESGAGTLAGTIDGARLVLSTDSTYTSDVVVRWQQLPALPIPGLAGGPEPRVLHGHGRYVRRAQRITLEPQDLLSRSLTRTVDAASGERTLTLTGASGGLAGEHVTLDAEFTRVR